MPTVKISHVISFSSEDPSFPASNIIRNETFKKWKCKSSGEKQASLILQLEKACIISSIDIGNEYSAFVEVLAGRSGGSAEEFQVLLVASSFMSPLEARNGTSANRVRMFSKDQLSKPANNEKWDRIKIICTQPFNSNIQFGLTFVTFHTQEEEVKKDSIKPTTLGRFTIIEEEDSTISVGSLFAKQKGKQTSPLSVAAAIRKASLPPSKMLDIKKPATIFKKTEPKIDESVCSPSTSYVKRKHQVLKDEKDDHSDFGDGTRGSIENKNLPTKQDKPLKQDIKEEKSPRKKKKRNPVLPEGNLHKPFRELLKGVVFVLSGYQNPLRQTLRDKAFELGAKYKPDWTQGCTHLICAFPNTPKFQQVRGKGCIVGQQWIEDCHSQRKRLPWRRYALDRPDQRKDESEEEIWETVSSQSVNDTECKFQKRIGSDERGYDSGSGTDEEIERVKLESLRESQAKKGDLEKFKRIPVEDPYEGDTDKDSDNEDRKENHLAPSNRALPPLPDYFSGKLFFIHSDLESDTKALLFRYITAFKGRVSPDLIPLVDYLVAGKGMNLKLAKPGHANLIAVTPDWIWKCNDEEKLLPTIQYEID